MGTTVHGGVIDQATSCLSELQGVTVAHSLEYPYRAGALVSADGLPLNPRMKAFLRTHERLHNQLFSHQFAGVSAVLMGKHTVVSTPTASGKSLIFGLPTLHALAEDQSATALLIYPQKALANDQLGK